MNTEIIKRNETEIAVINSQELLIRDVPSALDLMMTVSYETGCKNIALNKEAVTKDFYFQPSLSLAVEKLAHISPQKGAC